MNQVNTVWALANEFVLNPTQVSISAEKIREVANEIDENANWVASMPIPEGFSLKGTPLPAQLRQMFLYEIIAGSVNYCFWYGKHNIRPNGASSTKMYKLLDESFLQLEQMKKTAMFHPDHELEIVIDGFIGRMSRARFPLMEHRVRHLKEILNRSENLLREIEGSVEHQCYDMDTWLDYLITTFPGYGADLFLKRAFLFIIQMYRRCGLFEDAMSKILVPADYQIPKMLRQSGCITYSSDLAFVVDNNLLVPHGSVVECEIRAATIWVCSRIAELAGCTCETVDTYLFAQRHTCTDPFHLTITTDY